MWILLLALCALLRKLVPKLVRWGLTIFVLCRQLTFAQELPRIVSITSSVTVGPQGPPGLQGPPGTGATYGTYSAAMAAGTVWSIPGNIHGRSTCVVTIQIWTPNAATHDKPTCNPSTFDIVITFPVSVVGNVIITSDPIFLQPQLSTSMITIVVPQIITTPTTVITHNLGGVVLVRCVNSAGQPIGFNTATPTTSNVTTVTFIGAVSGVCIAAR